ncbi:MAG: non-hydrolyzing UDP-N-acetylglucosamine 2-epimerase [Phocaeicola sp.]
MQTDSSKKVRQVTIIAGTRPNFVKVAPIINAIEAHNQTTTQQIHYRLVHTGQHYDKSMSSSFFVELEIPEPHINLGCGGGTQAEQTAAIMIAFEKELQAHPSDLVLVVGDVTSTMACTLVAKKMLTQVAHVEAGIRSFDKSMPEEINRIVTDSLADIFFTTSKWASQNLRKSGIDASKIHFVGNVMIDTLRKYQPHFSQPLLYNKLHLTKQKYLVLTLHRPSNVDNPETLKTLLDEILAHSKGMPILFPMHPRTAQLVKQITIAATNLHTLEPLSYLEFNYLVENSLAVITDSGGITEETTILGIPCMTLRDTTERPETCQIGTNELIGSNPKGIGPAMEKIVKGEWKKGGIPPLWDGESAKRIVKQLAAK